MAKISSHSAISSATWWPDLRYLSSAGSGRQGFLSRRRIGTFRDFGMVFLLATATWTADAQVSSNAGALAYSCNAGSARYLLAKESVQHRGWSYPGGKSSTAQCHHADNCEPPIATALRELYEETRCTIGSKFLSSSRISGPSVYVYQNNSGRSENFATFLVQIPHLDPGRIAASRACETTERSDWGWADHSEIWKLASIQGTTEARLIDGRWVKIWSHSIAALRQAKSDKLLEEQDPCR